jgi:CheY-specific phosphatase CheX
MAVKFFGQFLIERGEIDAEQLRDALTLMRAENKQLGEIGVEEGFLRQTDTDWLNLQQRSTDRNFGDLAVDMGLLKVKELDESVALQFEGRLLIGEALVRLGSLPANSLPDLLDQFKLDQAPYEPSRREMNSELRDNPVAPLLLDLLPKFCMRMANVHVKTGDARAWSGANAHPFNVGVTLSGEPGLSISLVYDDQFGRRLSASSSGLAAEGLSEDLICDGVGELLNVVCGNIVAILERDGIVVELEPPVRDRVFASGVEFELAVGEGSACLILEVV